MTTADLKTAAKTIEGEIEAEFLAAGEHVLENGLVKDFTVHAFEGSLVIESGWSGMVSQVLPLVGRKVKAMFPGATFKCRSRRGFQVYTIRYPDGSFKNWRAEVVAL